MTSLAVLALAETASYEQVYPLREAIWKHLAHCSSLRATSVRGYKLFHLEFHLPFFALQSHFEAAPHSSLRTKSGELLTDLSFLEPKRHSKSETSAIRKLGMFEGHFSIVVSGGRENRWIAYSFDNTQFEEDKESLKDRIFCGGLSIDPIASFGSVDVIDAEMPNWDPREYFLNVVSRRVRSAADSWEALFRAIERKIRDHRRKHASTLSCLDGKDREARLDEFIKIFDWTRQVVETVNLLRHSLSETNQQWGRFNSRNGDVNYFSDPQFSDSSARIQGSLCEICEEFQRLQTVQRCLEGLSAACKDSARALELRLSLESSFAQTESSVVLKTSRALTDFQIFILLPIAVAAACLEYAPALMPLPPAPAIVILTGVFIITIKLLHIIFAVFPSSPWWWNMIFSLKKSIKLHGMTTFPHAIKPSKRRYDNDFEESDEDIGNLPV